jgi:hypothetical protein
MKTNVDIGECKQFIPLGLALARSRCLWNRLNHAADFLVVLTAALGTTHVSLTATWSHFATLITILLRFVVTIILILTSQAINFDIQDVGRGFSRLLIPCTIIIKGYIQPTIRGCCCTDNCLVRNT